MGIKIIDLKNETGDKKYSSDDLRNTIIHGHVMEAMVLIPDESVDMCLTSPPYWALRDYDTDLVWFDGDPQCEHNDLLETYESKKMELQSGNPEFVRPWREKASKPEKKQFAFCKKCGAWYGQLGLEPTVELYLKHLMNIFNEVRRILKPSGSCWVNLGDGYISENGKKGNNIPCKSLVGVPQRFMIKMIDSGWLLRNEIIWDKPNSLPSSAKDRFTKSHEYIYFFTKSSKYFFKQQLEPVLELNRWGGEDMTPKGKTKYDSLDTSDPVDKLLHPRSARPYKILAEQKKKPKSNWNNWCKKNDLGIGGKKYQNDEDAPKQNNGYIEAQSFRNKRTVWAIPTKPYSEAHFAVFPETLITIPIDAGCPKHICVACGKIWEHEIVTGALVKCGCEARTKPGIVLDPFMGSGTTGKVAKDQGKDFLGIELNKDYLSLIQKRISPLAIRLNEFL